jgi:hypothetical protein
VPTGPFCAGAGADAAQGPAFPQAVRLARMQGAWPLPIAVLADMTGVDRRKLHPIFMGAPVSADYCILLTPCIHQGGRRGAWCIVTTAS